MEMAAVVTSKRTANSRIADESDIRLSKIYANIHLNAWPIPYDYCFIWILRLQFLLLLLLLLLLVLPSARTSLHKYRTTQFRYISTSLPIGSRFIVQQTSFMFYEVL